MVDLAKSIQDLGLAGIIVLMVVVAAVGLARQWWAPGWIYKRELDGRITAEIQAARNAEHLATSSAAYDELSKAYAELVRTDADIVRQLAELRRIVTNERAARRRTGSVDGPP